jgi:hypothetical protein
LKREMRIVKKSAGLSRELLVAIPAFIDAPELSRFAVGVIPGDPVRLAMNALNAVGPADIDQMLDAPFLCLESLMNLVKSHGSSSIQEQSYPIESSASSI